MGPDLSDSERDRFARLREKLDGVSRATRQPAELDASPGAVDPMLATAFEGDLGDLAADEWIAERKFDGTRLILEKFDGEVSVFTRRHVERSALLGELTDEATSRLPDGLVIDGEYTFLTPEGVSRFLPIHTAGDTVEAEKLSASFFAFDLLAIDHEWCTRDPVLERKDRLASTVRDGKLLRVVEQESADFQDYYDELVGAGEEGIMLKRRGSPYHLGTRSDHWRKVKAFTETDVVAVGFTPGEGARAETFGALVMTDGEQYVGRVGSGFSDAELDTLRRSMTAIEERPVAIDQVGMSYTPVEPFVIQVKYQAVTESHELRAPVFLRARPNKPIDDIEPIAAEI